MAIKDIEFKTSDHVTLRGWLFTPQSFTGKLSCIVMASGFGAIRKMGVPAFAEHFINNLPVACLVYDNRGLGDSDVKEGEPAREIIPHLQISDYSDAITFAQTLKEIDPEKIAVWGSSYTGGHVLCVGAVDRRVKVVLSQVPIISGSGNFYRTYRPGQVTELNKAFQEDRIARAEGKEPRRIPLIDADLNAISALPTQDSYDVYTSCFPLGLINDVTLKSIEALRGYEPGSYIHLISPTPLMLSVMDDDVVTPTDIALEAFERAKEPKELLILRGGHFDPYAGPEFDKLVGAQTAFLKKHLL